MTMSLPGFTGENAVYKSEITYVAAGAGRAAGADGVIPQFCVCTPCISLPSGRQCFRVFGRRICFTIPSIGRWKACACGLPFGFSPRLRQC